MAAAGPLSCQWPNRLQNLWHQVGIEVSVVQSRVAGPHRMLQLKIQEGVT